MRLIEAPAKSFVSIARIAAIDGRRQELEWVRDQLAPSRQPVLP
jgi:hypothetical protein